MVKKDNFVGQVLTFSVLCTSLYSTFIWPGMLILTLVTSALVIYKICRSVGNSICMYISGLIPLSLVLIKRSEDLKVSPGMFILAGWG